MNFKFLLNWIESQYLFLHIQNSFQLSSSKNKEKSWSEFRIIDMFGSWKLEARSSLAFYVILLEGELKNDQQDKVMKAD
jgi:hypothetical protein